MYAFIGSALALQQVTHVGLDPPPLPTRGVGSSSTPDASSASENCSEMISHCKLKDNFATFPLLLISVTSFIADRVADFHPHAS